MNWLDTPVVAAPRHEEVKALHQQLDPGADAWIRDLDAAAERFDRRTDQFANGKGRICRDIAAKLRKFRSFASPAQAEFARKLVEWSKPREVRANPAHGAPYGKPATFELPRLFAILQRHSTFHAGDLKLSRKNGESLVWVIWHDVVVGKIENGLLTLFSSRLHLRVQPDGRKLADGDVIRELLDRFEESPLEAAKAFGRESGRCCSCGRDLTDPESIANGIGPVCATKFH